MSYPVISIAHNHQPEEVYNALVNSSENVYVLAGLQVIDKLDNSKCVVVGFTFAFNTIKDEKIDHPYRVYPKVLINKEQKKIKELGITNLNSSLNDLVYTYFYFMNPNSSLNQVEEHSDALFLVCKKINPETGAYLYTLKYVMEVCISKE